MSNEYTFYYFNLYVRGEGVRMLLNHAGVPFEDKRVEFPDWPALKPTMPGNQLPALQLKDGRLLGQSKAILRFVGMKHGYYPDDPVEAAHAAH